MSSLEKRHTSRRGSMQGHHKYSDGFNDTSSAGSFLDETDREVSNLTDRAFRSLCIGEEAIYNDSEISSPTERHKAFAEEVQQKEVLKTTSKETLSYGIQYGEAERKSEVTSTFQHSYVDVAQEQVLRDEHTSYMSNGSMEATWQQRRSTSRVSSLIKAFSSREGYCDSGTPDAVLLRDKYRDHNNGSWDKSALLSIQREMSEFSSTYHQSFKSGPFQSYRNHFHASAAAMARVDTTTSVMKSSRTKFQALNSTNFFFHSEFSPFQLWKDYNRFPFEREEPSGFMSASEFPRWYDSPLYKELTATNTFSSESRRFNRRKIEDVVPTQRSRSTVIQKASAIEKRCESEMASNCPPWRRNDNFVRSKLPSNRPSTVSPTKEATHRPNSSLLSHCRHTYDIQHRVESVGDNQVSSSSTPFNISQLLTPVIHGRQETETSEILQFAHTPSLPDYSGQGDVDLKPLSDIRQLRDSYKSKASSLLFNLKDNRKRVKSTYSPSKFKSLEITDRNKQPSMLEDFESRLSDTSASQTTTQEHSMDSWEVGDQQIYEPCLSQTVEHQEYADGLHHNMTSASHYGADNYNISYGGSQFNSYHPDKLSNKGSKEFDFSPHLSSAQNKSTGNSEGHMYGLSKKPSPTRSEPENVFTKACTLHPPAHSSSAQMSEKRAFGGRDMGHHDLIDRQNLARKNNFGYTTNVVTGENLSRENREPLNITNKEMINNNGIKDSLTFKGEIAALIEMDKQRKATAKQYLPSVNSSYTTGKETYIHKVNENIKQGRLVKEEEDQDTEGVSQKYPYTNRPAQGNPTNALPASQNLYEFQNNTYKSSSPPKESSFTRHDKVQRNMQYDTSHITAEKDCCQKMQSSISLEEKHQKHEGSVAYQPYKYEPNKQWHIAATENRRIMDDVSIPLQQQQNLKKSEQPAETHHAHPILDVSDISQQNTAYKTRTTRRNLNTEDIAKTGEHKPHDSMAPKLIYQTKHRGMKGDINKLNIQGTEPNNNSSQAREDKFSINDILSVRDNEQAKRIRENKHSFTANVSEPTKFNNQAFPSDIAEETKIFASKIKEQQMTQDPALKHDNVNVAYGYIRNTSHIPSEGFVNIGTAIKDKSGKETFMNKENMISPKPLSYKERGQTKQEILTSKLKAHAQKEISAIKEKGLAKQGILSRNPVKQNTAVNSAKGQVSQDVLSPKKEITAEKLNHLFQDITYSSVTLYKEHRDGPMYEPFTTEEITLPKRAIGPQAEVALSEKNNEAVKDDKLTNNEKERTKVQPLTQRTQSSQDEKITEAEKKSCEVWEELNKSTIENQKEQSVNESIACQPVPAKYVTNSPAMKSVKTEASVVKTEAQASYDLPTIYSANPIDNRTVAAKGKESPKYVGFGKITPCSPTTYSDLQQVKSLDHSVNKTEEQPSNAKVDKTTASNVPTDHKCTDLTETTRPSVEKLHRESQSNALKERLNKESNEKMFGISARQVRHPSDWTGLKDGAPPVESALGSSDNKNAPLNIHKANSTKDEELTHGDASFNANEAPDSTKIMTSYAKEKETLELCAKQDVTSKTNENSSIQQLQHVDTHKVKPFENVERNKGNPTLGANKKDKMNSISTEVNGRFLQEELKRKTEGNPHSEKDETQQISYSKQETRGSIYPNSPILKTSEKVTGSIDHQLQQDSDRRPDSENQIQCEKDASEQVASASKEIKQVKDKSTLNKNYSKPTGTENEKSPEKPTSLNVTINNTDEQMDSQTAQDKSSDIINPEAESKIIHIPSKEENAPADEPVIYSIRVSSKSANVVSEDEPVIYTICVSSISDSSMTDGLVSQDTHSFGGKQLSTEGAEKEGETSGNKNEETETDHLESKASDSEEARVLFSSDKAEKEPVIRKYESPATNDKHDYCRSSEVNNISSSYESLLAKYGLHRKSDQKEPDKTQEKEKDESTNKLSEKLQKNSVNDHSLSSETIRDDIAGPHRQETSKDNLPEENLDLIKKGEENEQHITHLMKTNGGLTQEAAGIIANSDKNTNDKKQLGLQNELDISERQKSPKSKIKTTCVDSQVAQPTFASKQNTRNDNVKLNGKKQVGQKVKAVDLAREKENDDESELSKKVVVANENDHQKADISTSSTNISKSTTIIGNYSGDATPSHSKDTVSVKDGKVSETVEKEKAKYDGSNKVPKQDTTHLNKLKPDTPPVQRKKAITEIIETKELKLEHRTKDECERNVVKPAVQSKEHAPIKDNKALQNIKKELVWKNELSVPEQAKFKTSNETNDVRNEPGVTTFSNKQKTVKENCSVSEDLYKNASTSIKVDQSLFKAPNAPLENTKVNIDQHKVDKDIATLQDRMPDQQKQIRTDNVSARNVMLPQSVNAQSATSQKPVGQKPLTVMSLTEGGSERVQKWKDESAPRQRENAKDEITSVNKKNVKKANLVKVEEGTEGESKKDDKEGTAHPQVKKDDTVTVDKVRKDGQAKSNVGAVVVQDNSHNIKEKTGNTGEGSHDRVNVYQYHPGKGFLPETKANTNDEQSCIGTNHHDMVPRNKEGTSTKSEVMQREKKSRPDISALADYARLRVISAEDENTSEKDLLQKIDTYRKYNLASVEPQEGLHGNPLIPYAEAKRELTVNKSNEKPSHPKTPLQVHDRERRSFQRSRITEGLLEGHNQFTPRKETLSHPNVSSLAISSDDRVAVKETGSTKDKALTNQMQSNARLSLTEQHYGHQRSHEIHQSSVAQVKHTLVSQVEGKNDDPVMIRKPVHGKLLEKDTHAHVKNQESLPQTSMGSLLNEVNKQADDRTNAVSLEMNDAEKVEELEYYTVSTLEGEPKPKEMHEALPLNNTSLLKKEVPEIETTRPRSNASSPAMGKPTMFRVKDNTIRTSSVTKAVKPRFHRSFSEELKLGSPKEIGSGSEKDEHDHQYHPKESANPPVLYEPAVASQRLPRAREFQSQHGLPSAEFTAAKDPRSYRRRSQVFEDDETRSVISTVSEDVGSFAGSSVVMTDGTASREMKSNRSTYVRPESACYERPESSCYERPESSCYERPESSCYERPESSCYERPESACSDIRSMGKPPVVPPKSDKALRRAQKLTTRRIKKAEAKMTSDSQGQLETKPVRAFSSLPSSPMELISTNHTVHASPPISHYHVEPNYAPPAPSLVAHPFPVTQRKLLQDPNSGQYFMVDMPVQVKTKMFFDPETGKYVQLNVRQRTQSTLSQPQPVEVLNHSYVVYPGFLPMSVSTLPSLRSSSQMSAPATLVEEQNKLEASREPGRQQTSRPKCHNNNNAVYRSHEQSSHDSLYPENNVKLPPRHTDIITMSELEDFAMEST